MNPKLNRFLDSNYLKETTHSPNSAHLIQQLSQKPPANSHAPFLYQTSESHGTKQKSIRAGDWVCQICGNLNYSFRNVCNRCKLQTKESNKLPVASNLAQNGKGGSNWDKNGSFNTSIFSLDSIENNSAYPNSLIELRNEGKSSLLLRELEQDTSDQSRVFQNQNYSEYSSSQSKSIVTELFENPAHVSPEEDDFQNYCFSEANRSLEPGSRRPMSDITFASRINSFSSHQKDQPAKKENSQKKDWKRKNQNDRAKLDSFRSDGFGVWWYAFDPLLGDDEQGCGDYLPYVSPVKAPKIDVLLSRQFTMSSDKKSRESKNEPISFGTKKPEIKTQRQAEEEEEERDLIIRAICGLALEENHN